MKGYASHELRFAVDENPGAVGADVAETDSFAHAVISSGYIHIIEHWRVGSPQPEFLGSQTCREVATLISVLGTGQRNLVISLGIVFMPSFIRIVRSEFIRLRDADYISRARLMGVGRGRILFIHILPNIFSTFWVSVMIGFNNAILAESGMSYLGIGVQPPQASLGKMLSDAQGYLTTAPWYALAPGLTIVWIVLGFSLLSEGIQRLGK